MMYGRSVMASDEPLEKITIHQLLHTIRQPEPSLASLIAHLRRIRTLDPRIYAEKKRQLPYFTTSIFNPPFRRKENFVHTQFIIIDFDHVSQEPDQLQDLKNKFFAHPAVKAIFTSPGADGLKLLFELKEPLSDAPLYSAFYKVFATRLATELNATQWLDRATHDISRATFISHDPDLLSRTENEKIDVFSILPPDDLFAIRQEVQQAESVLNSSPAPPKQKTEDLNPEILNIIKSKLNPKARPLREKKYYVPPEVDQLKEEIIQYFAQSHIEVVDIQPINFGRKFQLKAGNLRAEINLFYGKKGYSVVPTPKTGTHPQLNDLCRQLLEQFLTTSLSDLPNPPDQSA
ncbi:MAG: CRISPR-associated primase-polymerase type B [Thermaurantimonas sp.]|uniref:CRISPR-associated primase-polymerase type B n=1 Tax=Thermaurantimonas sp. TaxID=2681568 RepID=UPI0039193317